MVQEQIVTPPPPEAGLSQPEPTQLVQVRVPLDEAGDALSTRDASGRIPLVVIPVRLNRIRNNFWFAGLVILVAGVAGGIAFGLTWLIPPAVVIALALIVLAFIRAFFVSIPEGANGLLMRRGRYEKTLGSGRHVVPPWVLVSHLVTRREVPFDAPVVAALTRDNVRANVDVLLTFAIVDPYRFVFGIATEDFDQVLQAACQEALRTLLRRVPIGEVPDLTQRDDADLRGAIGAAVEAYGVEMRKVAITFAEPPAEFIRTQEARELAVAQRAEQIEKQALAQQRQADAETLARQDTRARLERERDALQLHLMQAEAHQQVVTLEAETEALRLAQLEERLRRFPHAAQYDWESQQLEVARALAGNTRAVLQVGSAADITPALLIRDAQRDGIAAPSGDAGDHSTHPPSASDSAPAGADATAVGAGHLGANSQL